MFESVPAPGNLRDGGTEGMLDIRQTEIHDPAFDRGRLIETILDRCGSRECAVRMGLLNGLGVGVAGVPKGLNDLFGGIRSVVPVVAPGVDLIILLEVDLHYPSLDVVEVGLAALE